MPDFKKHSSYKGGGRSGGFSRPSFGGPRRGGRDFGRPQTELFTATCNNCSAACEVPFRPNGTKPVYCKNCFVRNDEPRAEGRAYEKRSFNEQRPTRAPSATSASDPRIGAMQNELKEVHAKLDLLITRLQGSAYAAILASSHDREDEVPAKKVTVKKVAVKKAAPKKVVKKKA